MTKTDASSKSVARPERASEAAADPIGLVAALREPTSDDLIEALMAWAQSVFGADEIVLAREEFFSLAGKVFHDDTFYEARINCFFDFFLLERQVVTNRAIANIGPITPLGLFLRRCELGDINIPETTLPLFSQLSRFKHGIFQVQKVKNHTMTVRDLCGPDKYQIVSKNGETFQGFEKKDIFQGVLFLGDGTAWLSQGIIQHPVKAARVIKKYLKLAVKDPQFSLKSTLSKLARQQLRFLRHRHVDPVLLYQTEPR